jgi:hypothetical protein
MGFGRGALLWLIGIPLPIILLLANFYAQLTFCFRLWFSDRPDVRLSNYGPVRKLAGPVVN